MKKFIVKSAESKKVLHIAQVSSSLPVNILIRGERGVGKKLLCKEISPAAVSMDGKFLETSIRNKNINLEEYQELIVTDIHRVLNKKEFLAHLSKIKIIGTSQTNIQEIEEEFAIKIDISPLKERPEDLEQIANFYIQEANEIYNSDVTFSNITTDIEENGVSLKKSIYKNTLLFSLNDEDMTKALENFIAIKLDEDQTYKYFLKTIEIPLLIVAKEKFKSQLQMATKLNINRITLRKKIDQYFGTSHD
ncbi:MAG: sigma 54-interacting transcriptional regulator [Arcobacteraceae bacterium]